MCQKNIFMYPIEYYMIMKKHLYRIIFFGTQMPQNGFLMKLRRPKNGIDESWLIGIRIKFSFKTELIKKIWEADPLECPKCGGEMKVIALIDERSVIEKILRHLGIWEEEESRVPFIN